MDFGVEVDTKRFLRISLNFGNFAFIAKSIVTKEELVDDVAKVLLEVHLGHY